jgi:hypothetical protein
MRDAPFVNRAIKRRPLPNLTILLLGKIKEILSAIALSKYITIAIQNNINSILNIYNLQNRFKPIYAGKKL